MATTITGKLNKAASQFQAGESVGFGVRLGQQYYDRETQQKEWTNYEAAIFAKNPQQIQFYQQALVEGAVIEVTGESIKVKQFNGQNGLQITLELQNAKLGYVHTAGQQQGFNQQQAPQQQGNYSQQQQGYGNQQQGGFAPQQQGQMNQQQGNQNPPF